jgi:hypothetical protein
MGNGVRGNGFVTTGVCGRQVLPKGMIPESLHGRLEDDSRAKGEKVNSSGLGGVMGDIRSGLVRPWNRTGFARASAAAISIEMLLPVLE